MLYEKLLERRSQRNYTNQKLDEETKAQIFNVINASPTSINGQGCSAIFIEDEQIKKAMSKLNWNQPHLIDAAAIVLFVTDINRTQTALGVEAFNNLSKEFKNELLFAGAVDATIAATSLTTYLLSKNIGSCFIGGVRTYPNQLQELLDLDENTLPVVALTIGYVEKQNDTRPKLNRVFIEKYNKEVMENEVIRYDEVMLKDYEKRDQQINWSQNTKATYTNFDKANGYVEISKLYDKIINSK